MDTKVFCFAYILERVKDFSFKKARAIANLFVEKWEREPADGGFQMTLDEWKVRELHVGWVSTGSDKSEGLRC
jgi:hypothetical protein